MVGPARDGVGENERRVTEQKNVEAIASVPGLPGIRSGVVPVASSSLVKPSSGAASWLPPAADAARLW